MLFHLAGFTVMTTELGGAVGAGVVVGWGVAAVVVKFEAVGWVCCVVAAVEAVVAVVATVVAFDAVVAEVEAVVAFEAVVAVVAAVVAVDAVVAVVAAVVADDAVVAAVAAVVADDAVVAAVEAVIAVEAVVAAEDAVIAVDAVVSGAVVAVDAFVLLGWLELGCVDDSKLGIGGKLPMLLLSASAKSATANRIGEPAHSAAAARANSPHAKNKGRMVTHNNELS